MTKGDYLRYKAEIATDADRRSSAEESLQAYKFAFDLANQNLSATNPVRLGLALNYSVFFYEILDNKEKACGVAREAFDAAIKELDSIQDETYKDSTLIMQLLRDNLCLWTQKDFGEDQDGEDVKVEDVE